MKKNTILDADFSVSDDGVNISKFDIYEEIFAPDEVRELVLLLERLDVPYEIEKPTKQVGDSIIVGAQIATPYAIISMPSAYFEKVDIAREKDLLNSIQNTLPADYYLNDYTNDELLAIISMPEKWHFRDWVFAKLLLQQRKVDINENFLRRWQAEHAAIAYKPQHLKASLKVLLPIFCLLLAFSLNIFTFAFFIPFPFYVWQGKTTLLDGSKKYTYDDSSRTWGAFVFALSCMALCVGLGLQTNLYDSLL